MGIFPIRGSNPGLLYCRQILYHLSHQGSPKGKAPVIQYYSIICNSVTGGSDSKASVYNAGDPGSIPGLGRFPGEGNVYPPQYSCLENFFATHGVFAIHGILSARLLVWVTFPFSRGSFQPRDQTQVSSIAGRFFTS